MLQSFTKGLSFTKVKIFLEITKLMCKAALNFKVIFMSGLNIELENNNNNNNNSNNIRCNNLYN